MAILRQPELKDAGRIMFKTIWSQATGTRHLRLHALPQQLSSITKPSNAVGLAKLKRTTKHENCANDATMRVIDLGRLTMIRISAHIDRTAFVLNAIIRTDGETAHPLSLIVIHVQIRKGSQAGRICVKGIVTTLGQVRIVSREKKVEVFKPIEARGCLTSEVLI